MFHCFEFEFFIICIGEIIFGLDRKLCKVWKFSPRPIRRVPRMANRPTGASVARSEIVWADHPSIIEDSNTGPRGDYTIIAYIRFDTHGGVLALKNTNF